MKRIGSQSDLSHTGKRACAGNRDSFPIYSDGTVEVIVSEDPAHYYRLHKAPLEGSSVWFTESLSQPFVEAGQILDSEQVRYRYILCAGKEGDEPLLTRVSLVDPPNAELIKLEEAFTTTPVLTTSPPVEGLTSSELTTVTPGTVGTINRSASECSVIIIGSREIAAPDVGRHNTIEIEAEIKARAERIQKRRLEAYNNLFLALYNHEPQIATTSIRIALGQCEFLVRLAELYGCLGVVRAHICASLHQYRDDLFKAIAKDPPRWLLISIPIRSGPIFAEAAIHCIGCWPQWPWKTSWDFIPSRAIALIKAKAFELFHLRANTERNLFLNTISLEARSARLGEGGSHHFDTWMVVAVFRDWLARVIRERREAGKEHLPTYYREMKKAGDAYLPLHTVEAMLFKFSGADFGWWNWLAEDLRLVKKFAEDEVAAITQNNLTLKVEGTKISYLTCSKILESEYPWVEMEDPRVERE
ncbi:MAG: hypothetical protein M1839_005939 [Geoglossum umbratile]|nr:MAG: hypothetical protein M1839_005939 [Geoglossum umbratile]